jgi:hypothetical protein
LETKSTITSKINRDIIFLVSSGVITSFSLNNNIWDVKFRTLTKSSWNTNDNEIYPQILTFPIRKNERDKFIIAIGEKYLTVLDNNGKIQFITSIPYPPDSPIFIEDINNDGINDIIISSDNKIYSYITKIHSGVSVISFLTIFSVLILILMYLSTFINLKDPYFEKSIKLNK